MKTKQHTYKKPLGQRRNQKGNKKSWDKWKWKYSISNILGKQQKQFWEESL